MYMSPVILEHFHYLRKKPFILLVIIPLVPITVPFLNPISLPTSPNPPLIYFEDFRSDHFI